MKKKKLEYIYIWNKRFHSKVIATNVQFLSWKEKAEKEDQQELENAVILDEDCTNFEAVEDDLPF